MADTTTPADMEAVIQQLRRAAGAVADAPLAPQLRTYRHLLYRIQELLVRMDRHVELADGEVTGSAPSARRAINAAVALLVDASLLVDDAAAIVESRQ